MMLPRTFLTRRTRRGDTIAFGYDAQPPVYEGLGDEPGRLWRDLVELSDQLRLRSGGPSDRGRDNGPAVAAPAAGDLFRKLHL